MDVSHPDKCHDKVSQPSVKHSCVHNLCSFCLPCSQGSHHGITLNYAGSRRNKKHIVCQTLNLSKLHCPYTFVLVLVSLWGDQKLKLLKSYKNGCVKAKILFFYLYMLVLHLFAFHLFWFNNYVVFEE